jgi:hypothetical protein
MLIENTYFNYVVLLANITIVYFSAAIWVGRGEIFDCRSLRQNNRQSFQSRLENTHPAFVDQSDKYDFGCLWYNLKSFISDKKLLSIYLATVLIVGCSIVINYGLLLDVIPREYGAYILQITVLSVATPVAIFIVMFAFMALLSMIEYIKELRLSSMKISNKIAQLFNKLTCKDRLNNGTWRLLVVASIPFTLFFIFPGIVFWAIVHLALWIKTGYNMEHFKALERKEKLIERELKIKEIEKKHADMLKELESEETKDILEEVWREEAAKDSVANEVIVKILAIITTREFEGAKLAYATTGRASISQMAALHDLDGLIAEGCKLTGMPPADFFKMVEDRKSNTNKQSSRGSDDEPCTFPF